MLRAILFCIALSLVSAKPKDQEVYRLSPESIARLNKIIQPCIEKTNAELDVFKKLIDGDLPDNDPAKNFLYCFATTVKFTDVTGHFNVNIFSALLGNHPLVKDFKAALIECNKIDKETPVETIYAMNLCFNQNMPLKFSI